jgi:acetyl esterase/lipase
MTKAAGVPVVLVTPFFLPLKFEFVSDFGLPIASVPQYLLSLVICRCLVIGHSPLVIPLERDLMRAALLLPLLFPAFLSAAELNVHRDLPYVEPRQERRTLDVYAPAGAKDLPVLVWIHGGGWRRGDKRAVQQKPQAFADRGFVFVSINYCFVPQVTIQEMTGDVARAIKWVHDHAGEYGGDGKRIFVAGHSAGAHLAALVCTDGRYLEAEGLSLALIKGCIPVDTAVYDVARQVESVTAAQPARAAIYREAFGDAASQRELSPVAHVAKDKSIPPFLILHVADRLDAKAQSELLAKALTAAGVSAKVVAGEGKTHGTINSELGLSGDKPTAAVFEFLAPLTRSPASQRPMTNDQ